ncbi:MAG: hypothetical protein ABIP78_07215, partial [Pyrinomonadaceae bacterium]
MVRMPNIATTRSSGSTAKPSNARRSGGVSGTVFYSKKINDDLFFTTTAENALSQKENVATLWHINAKGDCKNLASFEKDLWHNGLFMFGRIH